MYVYIYIYIYIYTYIHIYIYTYIYIYNSYYGRAASQPTGQVTAVLTQAIAAKPGRCGEQSIVVKTCSLAPALQRICDNKDVGDMAYGERLR